MYYEKLLNKLKKCSELTVPVTRDDRLKYQELYNENPQAFRTNLTYFHYTEMKSAVLHGKVWKEALMGKTRHGKSEVAQTWSMILIDLHNYAIQQNSFNNLKEQGIDFKLEIIPQLHIDNILFSQSNFLYTLRKKQQENRLIIGEVTIIDEDEESIGGLGSMSEKFEIDNINNITAQAIQHEFQIRPDKFVLKNSAYCLFQEKMDRVNKINWSMLYEVRNDPNSKDMFRFIGWVATPLHEDNEFRKIYNKKKKENIIKVIEGTNDMRLLERMEVSRKLSVDEKFIQRTINGKQFKFSVYQQECILDEWIMDRKIQNFNIMEKQQIVQHARMIAEENYRKNNVVTEIKLQEVKKDEQQKTINDEFKKDVVRIGKKRKNERKTGV